MYEIHLPTPHAKQQEIEDSKAKRKIVRAGRRSGKTTILGRMAVKLFFSGRRILYATPTQDQIDRFWYFVTNALYEPVENGVLYKNETRHFIEKPRTEQRIRAKTAWNADTLRGDYADLLIFDEWQLMNENTWDLVGAPMLLDNDGDAIFVYTPPSLQSRNTSKATDPMHAAKMYKRYYDAMKGGNDRYFALSFTSYDNPHISREAIDELAFDMTSVGYRMEIMAEDVDEAPGALWTRDIIETNRTLKKPDFDVVVVAIDPSATATGNEAGIITAGRTGEHSYPLADDSIQASPHEWAAGAIAAYHRHQADHIVAESNNGGEMVKETINAVDPDVPVKLVHASRGKATRAEPISARYEKGLVHHIGSFPLLEDEMCLWVPGNPSPNRMDALVWALTDLYEYQEVRIMDNPFYDY